MDTSLLCNPNLLDNPDFKINQRGQITYTPPEVGAIYTCDRWCVVGGAVTFGDEGATFADGIIDFYQNSLDYNLADWQGKDFTMSINLDGVIYYDTVKNCDTSTLSSGYNFVFGDSGWVGTVIFNWWKTNSLLLAVKPSGHNGSLKKVKFELGDISTLQNDPPSNPVVELLKCQRYYVDLKGNIPHHNNIAPAVGYNATTVVVRFSLPVTVRTHPTFLCDLSKVQFYSITPGGGHIVGATAVNGYTSTGEYIASFTVTGAIQGALYDFRMTDDSQIVLSAEL